MARVRVRVRVRSPRYSEITVAILHHEGVVVVRIASVLREEQPAEEVYGGEG